MLKLTLQYFGHLMQSDSSEKILMLGKIEGGSRRGQHRMRWLDGITDLMDMSLNKLEVGDGQGGLACYNPWGCKEWDTSDWTELNWTDSVYLEEKETPSRKRTCEMENFRKEVIISLDFDRSWSWLDLAKMLGSRSFLSRESRMSTEVAKQATTEKWVVQFLLDLWLCERE